MSRHHKALSNLRWGQARLACFERDNYRCQAPECRVRWPLEAHHLDPLAAGGAEYELDNLLTLCRDHHIEEHRARVDAEDEAWRDWINELLE